jgi:Fe-S-cluster containining protein
MDLIKKKGFGFAFDPKACDSCNGRCCTGEAGHIWVTDEEIEKMSRFLGLGINSLVADYVVRVNGRFSLKEVRTRGRLECICFDNENGRCSVYSVRPTQCRTYPFWDCFRKDKGAAMRECPGVYANVVKVGDAAHPRQS